jgi:hypothetical protein
MSGADMSARSALPDHAGGLERLNEIKARLAAAEADAAGPWSQKYWPPEAEGSGWDAELELRCEPGGEVITAMGSTSYTRLLGQAPSDLAFLLDELDAIEGALTTDRDALVPERRGMSTSELVRAALRVREDAVREGARDRQESTAEIDRLKADLAADEGRS